LAIIFSSGRQNQSEQTKGMLIR